MKLDFGEAASGLGARRCLRLLGLTPLRGPLSFPIIHTAHLSSVTPIFLAGTSTMI